MARFFRHFRYVMSENLVTAGAFSLFFLMILLAVFGPSLRITSYNVCYTKL